MSAWEVVGTLVGLWLAGAVLVAVLDRWLGADPPGHGQDHERGEDRWPPFQP